MDDKFIPVVFSRFIIGRDVEKDRVGVPVECVSEVVAEVQFQRSAINLKDIVKQE